MGDARPSRPGPPHRRRLLYDHRQEGPRRTLGTRRPCPQGSNVRWPQSEQLGNSLYDSAVFSRIAFTSIWHMCHAAMPGLPLGKGQRLPGALNHPFPRRRLPLLHLATGYHLTMVRQLEAVYEGGVLRPLEPLDLQESQLVRLTVDDRASAPAPARDQRREEQDWLAQHASAYAGQWVALQGATLVAHGPEGKAVWASAQQEGVAQPLLVHLPDAQESPFAGW